MFWSTLLPVDQQHNTGKIKCTLLAKNAQSFKITYTDTKESANHCQGWKNSTMSVRFQAFGVCTFLKTNWLACCSCYLFAKPRCSRSGSEIRWAVMQKLFSIFPTVGSRLPQNLTSSLARPLLPNMSWQFVHNFLGNPDDRQRQNVTSLAYHHRHF